MNIKTWVQLVGDDKLVEMRQAATPAKKPALWIAKYLDDEQMAELYYRIFENEEDLKKLAKMVRDVWGIRPDWQLQDFYRGMKRWKQRLATPMSNYVMGRRSKKDKTKAKRVKEKSYKVYKNLEALGRLGYAIEVQMTRLEIAHEKEKAHNVTMDFVDTIQGQLNSMISNFVNIAIKTGILQGVPSEVNLNFKDRSDAVLSFIAGDAPKLVRATNAYLEDISKRAKIVDIDPQTGKMLLPAGEKE